MDALTDVIRLCRLRGTIFSQAWLDAPWGVQASQLPHGIFHGVVEGSCFVTPQHESPIELEEGDIVFLPYGTPHIMSHEPVDEAPSIFELAEPGEHGMAGRLTIDGGGVRTELVCGRVEFEQGDAHPLLEVLPTTLIARPSDDESESRRHTLGLIRDELRSKNPGAEIMIARLTEVLLVQALRDWLRSAHATRGWLGGLTDHQVARAMGYIHRQPEESWTVEKLARIAGMSRSSFASRFRELVGESPHRYLTRWRMHLASIALTRESASLAEIAHRVGYGSEYSFSKAFKNERGVAPSEFRAESSVDAGNESSPSADPSVDSDGT